MWLAWFLGQDSAENYFMNGKFEVVVGAGFELDTETFESIPDAVEVQIFMTETAADEWLDSKRSLYSPLD